jgi:hypothetical protein
LRQGSTDKNVMLGAEVFGGHTAHLLVLGLPVAALVSAVGVQEVQARWRAWRLAHDGEPQTGAAAQLLDRGTICLRAAASGLLLAAAVHASVIRDHFHEYVWYGLFFSVLASGQGVVALLLLSRPTVRRVRHVAIFSASVVVLWLASRTSGLPIGPEPWRPEAFGLADEMATLAEVVTFFGCVLQLGSVSRRRRMTHGPSLEVAR